MPKYPVIINPAADRGKVGKKIPLIRQALDNCGLEYEISLTRFPLEAADMAQKAALDGAECVVAGGGDGTINEVINGLLQAQKQDKTCVSRLGVLCAGRGNDFAYSMGIPLGLQASARNLVEGKPKTIDIGLATCELFSNGRYFGNGVGIGFDAVIGFSANHNRFLSGFLAYLWGTIYNTLIGFKSPEVRIVLEDGEEIIENILLFSIMNGSRIGGTFLIAPDSDPADGVFNLVFARHISRPKILSLIPRVMAGTHYSDPTVQTRKSGKVTITALKGFLPAHADGETLCTEGTEIQVEIIPHGLEIIAPAGKEN